MMIREIKIENSKKFSKVSGNKKQIEVKNRNFTQNQFLLLTQKLITIIDNFNFYQFS